MAALPGTPGDIEDELNALASEFPEIGAFRVFDAAGNLVYTGEPTSGAPREAINVADRLFFRDAQVRRSPLLAFSEVIPSRPVGLPTVVAYRPILGMSGDFLGVVAARLDVPYLARQFAEIDVGQDGMVSMRRADDSRLVVRWPETPGLVNHEARATPPFRAVQPGASKASPVIAAQRTTSGSTPFIAWANSPSMCWWAGRSRRTCVAGGPRRY